MAIEVGERELFNLVEAGELVGKRPSTLYRWVKSGKITHVRDITGRIYFRAEDLAQVWSVVPADGGQGGGNASE